MYGVLENRDAQLLELFSREGIDFELFWMQTLIQEVAEAGKGAAVWATLYGPPDLGPELHGLFQHLDLYLQDPIHALRDVTYFNPQRFFNEPDKRTSHFGATALIHEHITTAKQEDLVIADVLDSVTANCNLPETPESPYLLTELMRSEDIFVFIMRIRS